MQDDLGFLWIGTDDGLKRYDGYRIRDYRHDPKDPNSLADSYIISLFKDRSGKLWVASGRSLDVYDPASEKFTPFRADQRSRKDLQLASDKSIKIVPARFGYRQTRACTRSTPRRG